ncbi:hypothetical protein OSB04_018095 [Centaurea solstitialis]|uniref:EGF-like domain-containing protein n=1 Tax=Centaurea solstitialis TaxID=347529 RepID=A0AA38TFZ3_9ASTR|nr:hypothetical protein OSB04_018095 [Centaurea solstitialis]
MSIHESEMQIMMFVANDCYNATGLAKRNRPFLRSSTDFQVSTKNKFIAIGCDTHAYFNGTNGNKSVGTGCISYCSSKRSLADGSCSGVGCCEIAIPQGMNNFDISLSSYNNHKGILDFNPCSYGFFVERGRYDFLAKHLLDFGSVNTMMPMLLEWAIGNETCQVARSMDVNTFACKENSECVEEYGGPGYRCRCKDGYEGNPYIQNNCTSVKTWGHENILMSVKKDLMIANINAMIWKEVIGVPVQMVTMEMVGEMEQVSKLILDPRSAYLFFTSYIEIVLSATTTPTVANCD